MFCLVDCHPAVKVPVLKTRKSGSHPCGHKDYTCFLSYVSYRCSACQVLRAFSGKSAECSPAPAGLGRTRTQPYPLFGVW
jgi:hypothetical protein